MEQLPFYISLVLGLTTLTTVAFFYKATHYSRTTLLIVTGWILVQGAVALTGFYTETTGVPPRFVLSILPPFLLIAALFSTQRGRAFLDSLDIKTLTLLHAVRVPVELVLFWLFVHKVVPQVMTFEGLNFDILSGVTAVLVFYFAFVKKVMGRKVLLLWNILCLALLINIVVIAILAAPVAFQKLAFDQPNIAVFYFPFIWLPCCIVPLVALSHLACIRQLQSAKRTGKANVGTQHTKPANAVMLP